MKRLCTTLLVLSLTCSPTIGADLRVGEVDFENSGSAAAQEPFQLGIALLHNFEYPLAAETFREAQAADEDFALAYWGEAMAHNHPLWMQQNRDAALEILARLAPTPAEREAKAGSEREKAYMRAAEILYGDGDKKARDIAFSDAMGRIAAAWPDDEDALAFHALSILGTAHSGRDEATYMRAAAVAEEAFTKHPEHPGVVHYMIHSYDDPVHAPLGLRPARIYSRIAPDAAHAQHMTSHIFVAMGMWDAVILANQNAGAAANRVLASRGLPPFHCGHSNGWLLYGYLQRGDTDDAAALLEACNADRQRIGARASAINADGSPFHSWLVMRLRYLIDTGDWDGEIAHQDVEIPADYHAERMTYAFTQGVAAAIRGEVDSARSWQAELAEAKPAFDAQLEGTLYAASGLFAGRAEILLMQLDAIIDRAEGRLDAAIETLADAAESELALPLMYGPPAIEIPTLELLGSLHAETGNMESARQAWQAQLERTPGRRVLVQALSANTSG